MKKLAHRYFIVALNGMAMGLFSSLIIGTIISTIAKIPNLEFLLKISDIIGAKGVLYGGAIGAGVAIALKHKPYVILAAIAAGAIAVSQKGGPIGAYLAALVAAEVANLVCGKTKVDIIITPLVGILSGGIIAILIGAPINDFMLWLGDVINSATTTQPILMGIIIAVVVGMILTAPISSAAICITIGLSGVAAGAAAVGCSVQMVGFAVCSYRKNGIGGLIAVGIGTSMLQFTNIIRKPLIWLPTIIASAILGPISSAVFRMTNMPYGAGMGTCGLVGQIGAYEAMVGVNQTFNRYLEVSYQIILMHIILPIILVLGINFIFKKAGLIKDEDYLLNRPEKILNNTEELALNNEI